MLLSLGSFAQNASQLKLIEQKRRPKIADVISTPDNIYQFTKDDYNGRVSAIKSKLPELIVSLEKAFPGGTYGFLGRDMDLIADAVDSFYLSKGQAGRVQRIEFSTPSLENSTPKLMTDFLAQRGLDATGSVANPSPLILIDYTSYSTSGRTNSSFPSQARYIFESVVKQMKLNGLASYDIFSRINVATIDDGASSYAKLSNPLTQDRSDYIKLQAESLEANGKVDRITYFSVDGDSMAYSSEWTDKYGPIKKGKDGLLTTEPIDFFDKDEKTKVFSQMVNVVNLVNTEAMQNRISKLAEKHQVTFTDKPSLIVMPKVTIKKVNHDANLKNQILDLEKNMSVLSNPKNYGKMAIGDEKMKLTQNGQDMLRMLAADGNIQAPHFFKISLTALLNMHEQDKLGARDFRRIFNYLLSLKPIESSAVSTFIKNNYKKSIALEIMFGRDAEREKYSQQGGLAEENYKKIISDSNIKPSCKFIY